MSYGKFTLVIARAAMIAAIAVSARTTFAAGPATSDTAAELEALKARIAQLEAVQSHVDGAALQAKAVDAAIVDADSKHAFMDADSFTSGWENGFKIRSSDGAYELQPFVEWQFRYVANNTKNGDPETFNPSAADNDFQAGFENRRLKFGFKGNAFSKDFTYMFRFTADRSSGNITPDYAYATYKFAPEWGVRFGQFKPSWTHEWSVSDTKQLVVERSLIDQYVGGGPTQYAQGVALQYGSKETPVHAELAFTDGDSTLNTNYTDQQTTGVYQDFGVVARAEYKVFGNWEDYGDFTARKDEDDLLVIGAGADWAQGGDGDVYRMTVDAQYENTGGLSAYGALIYTIADDESTSVTLDQSWGALAQAGYLIPNLKDWEVFGRYGYFHLDQNTGGDHNDFSEITAGVNRYFVGHNAKLSIDLGYLPNGSFTAASGLGVTNTEDDQLILRGQFQLVL